MHLIYRSSSTCSQSCAMAEVVVNSPQIDSSKLHLRRTKRIPVSISPNRQDFAGLRSSRPGQSMRLIGTTVNMPQAITQEAVKHTQLNRDRSTCRQSRPRHEPSSSRIYHRMKHERPAKNYYLGRLQSEPEARGSFTQRNHGLSMSAHLCCSDHRAIHRVKVVPRNTSHDHRQPQ